MFWRRLVDGNPNWEPTSIGARQIRSCFFNDVDTATWQPFSWKLDPLTGLKKRMAGTVYHASPDGRWLISANLPLLGKTQAGYGLVLPRDSFGKDIGLDLGDGFYLTDTVSGERRLLVTIEDLMAKCCHLPMCKTTEGFCFYGFHSKFNSQGTKVMLSLRWFPNPGEEHWEVFKSNFCEVNFAWFTVDLKDGTIHCAIGPEHFAKGGHHANWCPDGENISLNLKLDGRSMRFVAAKFDGSHLRELVRDTRGSGHPTVHPSGRILTDTYLQKWDYPQYGDGTVPLRWVDPKTRDECVAVRIPVEQDCADNVLRVDPHPAWDRTWRYITFNGVIGGTRRVFLADMKPLLDGTAYSFQRKPLQDGFLWRFRVLLGKTVRKLTS
ncbi:hypothetical protein N8574_02035 [Akkermansiaceae bacterium]|nr:hypothetical protein [Akkermansiaceae bacterium]